MSSSNEATATAGRGPGSPSRRLIRLAVPAGILLGLGVFVFRLAVAPIAGVRDAGECDSAYADARTAADSNVVDLLSYPDTTTGGSPTRRRGRCGFRDPQVARGFGR